MAALVRSAFVLPKLLVPFLMDLDLRTVLRWLIIGVIALLGLSLLGLLIEVIRPLLRLVLKAGAIVLVVLLIIRVLEDVRS